MPKEQQAIDFNKIKKTFTQGLPKGRCVLSHEDEPTNSRHKLEYSVKKPDGTPLLQAKIILTPEDVFIASIKLHQSKNLRLQKLGIGKKLLQNIMQIAQDLDRPEISLVANDMGCYAWPRAGFAQSRESWCEGSLRECISERLYSKTIPAEDRQALEQFLRNSTDPKDLWFIADSLHGRELLIDQGFRATLRRDDPETMQRFAAYTALSPLQQAAIDKKFTQAIGAAR